tara:strand:- start:515 stop:1063 length:549 start_codon:yes stop_codon:yes gene_type:complete
MKTIIPTIAFLLATTLFGIEIKDDKADWVRGQSDDAFDIKSLKIERIDADRISLRLELHDEVPDFRERKTHYRFDFDLDLDDETGHDSNKFGGDSLIYVSLQPIESEKKEWTTYVRSHSEVGNLSDLRVEKLIVRRETISLEVVSDFFSNHDQFGLYVMTFGDNFFYDELPNKSEALIDLSK